MHLVTWNTQWCCGLDGEVRPERIVQTVQAMGECDVLCLQEIAINYPQLRGRSRPSGAAVASPAARLVGFWRCRARMDRGWRATVWQSDLPRGCPALQVQHYPLPYPGDQHVRTMQRMCTVVTVQDPCWARCAC